MARPAAARCGAAGNDSPNTCALPGERGLHGRIARPFQWKFAWTGLKDLLARTGRHEQAELGPQHEPSAWSH
jgi:hypothetical protein